MFLALLSRFVLLNIDQVAGYSDRRYLTANRTVPRGEPVENTRLTRAQIFEACDASLRRLQVRLPSATDG